MSVYLYLIIETSFYNIFVLPSPPPFCRCDMYSLLEEWLEKCDDDDDDHRNNTAVALCPSAAAHHGHHQQQQQQVHGLRDLLLWGQSMRMTEYDPDRRPTAAEALSLVVMSDSHRCCPAAPFHGLVSSENYLCCGSKGHRKVACKTLQTKEKANGLYSATSVCI